jgi:hypothetical protein
MSLDPLHEITRDLQLHLRHMLDDGARPETCFLEFLQLADHDHEP